MSVNALQQVWRGVEDLIFGNLGAGCKSTLLSDYSVLQFHWTPNLLWAGRWVIVVYSSRRNSGNVLGLPLPRTAG
eukprot:2776289-Amphidinium_carterae.1